MALVKDLGENRPLEHIERDAFQSWHYTQKVKDVLSGKSKRKTGFTQDEIACLFVHDYEAESSTGNFRSKNGILWHYQTIAALKTKDGLIIENRDDWSRGFARCSSPPLINYSLNLSLFPYRAEQLRHLEILDHSKNNTNGNRWRKKETLVKVVTERHDFERPSVIYKNEAYFLNAFDENRAFLVELHDKPRTVKEAFESMKPQIVKHAEAIGLTVKRQGDLFFIPTNPKRHQIKDVKQRHTKEYVHIWHECELCEIKGDRWGNHPYISRWHPTATQKQKDCKGTDQNMKEFLRLSFRYTPFPEIADTRHTVTKLATMLELAGNAAFSFTIAQGIVRHEQHRSLKLGTQWHIVTRNNVVQSYSHQGSGGD